MNGDINAAIQEAATVTKLPGYKTLKPNAQLTVRALTQFHKRDSAKAMHTLFDLADSEVAKRRQFLRSVSRNYAVQHDNRVQQFEKQLLENQLQIQQLQLSAQQRQQRTERWILILMSITAVSLAMWAYILVRSRQRFRKQAQTDALTGVSNRRHFFDFINTLAKRRQQLSTASVLMLDIDHFKCINDTYGHLAGDAAIKQVAAQALNCLGTRDLLGRTGGEEFAIIMPDTTAEHAWKTAERIRERIELHPLMHNEQKISLTISIGVAAGMLTAKDPNYLLQMADRAMYRAKYAGRNQSHLAELGDSKTSEQQQITDDIISELA